MLEWLIQCYFIETTLGIISIRVLFIEVELRNVFWDILNNSKARECVVLWTIVIELDDHSKDLSNKVDILTEQGVQNGNYSFMTSKN